jgi:hypothetical protein
MNGNAKQHPSKGGDLLKSLRVKWPGGTLTAGTNKITLEPDPDSCPNEVFNNLAKKTGTDVPAV